VARREGPPESQELPCGCISFREVLSQFPGRHPPSVCTPLARPKLGTAPSRSYGIDAAPACGEDDQVTSEPDHIGGHAHDLAAGGARAEAAPDSSGDKSNPICDSGEQGRFHSTFRPRDRVAGTAPDCLKFQYPLARIAQVASKGRYGAPAQEQLKPHTNPIGSLVATRGQTRRTTGCRSWFGCNSRHFWPRVLTTSCRCHRFPSSRSPSACAG
jgi:hypothetical protein